MLQGVPSLLFSDSSIVQARFNPFACLPACLLVYLLVCRSIWGVFLYIHCRNFLQSEKKSGLLFILYSHHAAGAVSLFLDIPWLNDENVLVKNSEPLLAQQVS